jgi:hypothetical protein
MMHFIPFLLLSLGFGLIPISSVEAKDSSKITQSHSFLFQIPDGSTWHLEDTPLTKEKAMPRLCFPVTIFDRPPSQPVGEGKVCLSGQNKSTEALSLWDLTLYMNFYFKTKETLVVSIPDTTVVNLTKAMTTAPQFHPIVISGSSRENTNSVLSGTGKFQGAHGTIEFFGVVDTLAIEPQETVSKYPFLGDIPILGALIRTSTKPILSK